MVVTPMRNRQKQRELCRAGIRREENIGARNAEGYFDTTPQAAVRLMAKEQKGKAKA